MRSRPVADPSRPRRVTIAFVTCVVIAPRVVSIAIATVVSVAWIAVLHVHAIACFASVT
jgi:hypothetical protein